MTITIHQTHHKIADFEHIALYCQEKLRQASGIHLFPELFLTGYPLRDLCLRPTFKSRYQIHLDQIRRTLSAHGHNYRALMGGLHYEGDHIYNCLYEFGPGASDGPIAIKQLLPNYDVFEEKVHYRPKQIDPIWHYQDKKFGLIICEDMYPQNEKQGPLPHFEGKNLDGLFTFSASPFCRGKESERLEQAKKISHYFQTPLYYINRVGGEDELLFDGNSFVLHGDEVVANAKSFEADILQVVAPSNKIDRRGDFPIVTKTLGHKRELPLKALNDADCELITKAIVFGIDEYMTKSGFSKISVAISGGLDSALVAFLCTLSKYPVEAIYMPSQYSSELSYQLSLEFCQKNSIPLAYLPVKFPHSVIRNTYKQTFGNELQGLSDENVQARLRAIFLQARSNDQGTLVMNTSNKSEISVGYSTLYGDSIGALSPIGDLFKTQVQDLARYHQNSIPVTIIDREPTAELRENQKDSDSLPPYDILDPILHHMTTHQFSFENNYPCSKKELEKVWHLYNVSEYKRKQFCPIIKINEKSFGMGHRIPISRHLQY